MVLASFKTELGADGLFDQTFSLGDCYDKY